jgi:hypothetical protein
LKNLIRGIERLTSMSFGENTQLKRFCGRIPRDEVEWMAQVVNDELQKIIVGVAIYNWLPQGS